MSEPEERSYTARKRTVRITQSFIRSWRYLRPHQTWQCGRPCQQKSTCDQGPNAQGQCLHSYAPCKPVRSQRSRRGRWVVALLSVMTLTLLGGFAFGHFKYNQWQWILSPGSLNLVHESMTAQCQSCHQDTGHHETPLKPHQCTVCHSFDQNAHLAHALPERQWTHYKSLNSIATATPKKDALQGPRCSHCHTEHKGHNGELTVHMDSECQTCHQATFSTLSSHPDFELGMPADQTAFRHNRHYKNYFRSSSESKWQSPPCETCHLLDRSDTGLAISPYEQSCATCHAEDITYEISKFGGIPFLTIPALDLNYLNTYGFSVGQWPTSVEPNSPSLDPITLSLLETETSRPISTALLSAIGSGRINLYTLESACSTLGSTCPDERWLANEVEKIAFAIKRLLLEFNRAGPAAFKKRWEAQPTGPSAAHPLHFDHMASTKIVQQHLGRAFTKLRTERLLEHFQTTEQITLSDYPSDAQPAPSSTPIATWVINNHRILYRPDQHKDPLVTSLLTRWAGSNRAASLIESDDGCFRCHNKPPPNDIDVMTPKIWEIGHSKRHTDQFKIKALFNRKFDHQTHAVGRENSCIDCHGQPLKPITFSTCHDCHGASDQTSTCQTCHTYHATAHEE